MTNISNTEKQVRFRKKEALKKYANQVLREMMAFQGTWRTKGLNEIQCVIDKAIELPSGWTDEDYEQAQHKLKQILLERYDNPHLLENDVHAGRYGEGVLGLSTAIDPHKYLKDSKVALKNTQALATHIISALNISECSDSDKAAALMEAIRFIGHSLANVRDVPKSNATTMCIASIGTQYDRPDWFAEKLAEILAWNLDKSLTKNVGERMAKFEYGV